MKIIGQEGLVDRLLIAILADGHLLVEGAPGLAKTRAIKVIGEGIEGDFHRIQFTPDLLPADLTGTDIYRPQDGSFILNIVNIAPMLRMKLFSGSRQDICCRNLGTGQETFCTTLLA